MENLGENIKGGCSQYFRFGCCPRSSMVEFKLKLVEVQDLDEKSSPPPTDNPDHS